jgi:single-stranded DNA-binding protein
LLQATGGASARSWKPCRNWSVSTAGKDGERQSRTEWHRIQILGRLGVYAAPFKKGSHICVEGELRSREYESRGAKIRTYDIVASSIINLRAGQRYTAGTPDPLPAPRSWPAQQSPAAGFHL